MINRVSGVSEQAAEAVRKAMEQVGYVHSQDRQRKTGSAANRRRHHSIAMLDLQENTSLSISILRIVQRILIQQGTNLVFGACGRTGRSAPFSGCAVKWTGYWEYRQFSVSAITPRLKQIPAVWMMSPLQDVEDAWGDRIMADHRAIGQLAARGSCSTRGIFIWHLNSMPKLSVYVRTRAGFCRRRRGAVIPFTWSVATVPIGPTAPRPWNR